MNNAELIVERRWSLAELERRFRETFKATLRIFDERNHRIVNDPRCIDEIGSVTVDNVTIQGSAPVGDIETLMQQSLGLKVRIATSNDWKFAPKDLPLYRVHEIPAREGYIDSHALKEKYKETK